MKALILAAGYATRLYPLTLNKPKPLLSIGTRPAIEHIIARISQIDEVDRILIVTNAKFFRQFQDWLSGFKAKIPVKVLNDSTVSEQDRLGAIGDMNFVINQEKIDDHLLVIAGDNLFELGLREFIDFSKQRIPASSIGLYDLQDKEAAKDYGQVRLDSANRITEFAEKPEQPISTLAAKCIYFFSQQQLALISEYVSLGKPLDAPGNYISWLYQNAPVYGFIFSGKWYDIGNKEIYKKANHDFTGL